jgi:hypothetical protein
MDFVGIFAGPQQRKKEIKPNGSQKVNPLWMEVYFCHQNQTAKNIGNFTILLKPHNIGTHLKGIETSFQVVGPLPLFLKSFHFWVSLPSVSKGLKPFHSGKTYLPMNFFHL